jgi:ubiquinone/menaquinone biosynthesis C-methylase UbiE
MKTKEDYELDYWLKRKAIEGRLRNSHYEYFYTTHFGIEKDFYANKIIVDIGCGPRGSLEWAGMAKERIGVDPLCDKYKLFGAGEHGMRYVKASSEKMPFADDSIDVVCSFNSLDHVNDLQQTIDEIIRITKQEGAFLLLTDVNHKPTHCEPISFSFNVSDKFIKKMKLVKCNHYEKKAGGMYESILENIQYNPMDFTNRYGILSSMFIKR